MFFQKSIQEKTDWFNKNFVAIPSGVFGNCSACFFRNIKPYCAKLDCSYCDKDTIETVCWQSTHHYTATAWPELSDFFSSTSVPDVIDISRAVVKQAMLKREHDK